MRWILFIVFLAGCATEPESHLVSAPPPPAPNVAVMAAPTAVTTTQTTQTTQTTPTGTVVTTQTVPVNTMIVTQVAPLEKFYVAEQYHQGYFRANPGDGYCQSVAAQSIWGLS